MLPFLSRNLLTRSDVGLRRISSNFPSFGPLPASTPTRPIATMHMAKTQIVRQPQWNRCLLRPKAYYRHYGSAAWIDPVILGTITISWNEIRIPVGCRIYGRDDENPSWFVMELSLPLGGSYECPRATQRQGCCESKRCGHCLHVSTPCQQRHAISLVSDRSFNYIISATSVNGTKSASFDPIFLLKFDRPGEQRSCLSYMIRATGTRACHLATSLSLAH